MGSHSIRRRATLMLLAGLPLMMAIRCETPTERPGPEYEGSARWALAQAQPEISNFAADAELYEVMGALIYKDGRLPPNTGSWSFIAWSPSRLQSIQVNVDHDGSTSTKVRSRDSAPSHNGQPVPESWANSTVVFAAVAPHLVSGTNHAVLAMFNVASYAQAPDEPLWGIKFDVGPNQLVRADGSYLGPL